MIAALALKFISRNAAIGATANVVVAGWQRKCWQCLGGKEPLPGERTSVLTTAAETRGQNLYGFVGKFLRQITPVGGIFLRQIETTTGSLNGLFKAINAQRPAGVREHFARIAQAYYFALWIVEPKRGEIFRQPTGRRWAYVAEMTNGFRHVGVKVIGRRRGQIKSHTENPKLTLFADPSPFFMSGQEVAFV